MGGKAAMLLARQWPELVERLVAVDISPVETTSSSDFPAYMAAMKAIDSPDEMSRSCACTLVDKQLSSLIQDTAVRHFLLTNLAEAGGRLVWRVNLDALAQNWTRSWPSHQDKTFTQGQPSSSLVETEFMQCRACLMLFTGSTPTAHRTSWLPSEASWPTSCW
uniref:Abhydrolase domain containing 11 n=1 Tax=Molossus molossus TaxID=27622 RepID=A0A7J8FZF7_MOLMO|nr:hypothetical protein HJG59_008195 [Molossus molossus]